RVSLGRRFLGGLVSARPDNAARAVVFAGAFLALAGSAGAADLPVKAPPAATAYDWTGLYVGGHIGYAAGSSHWSAMPTAAAGPAFNGALDLFNSFNAFTGTGSYFGGFQAGYNYMLPSRWLYGVEADIPFPITIAGTSTFSSAPTGPA